MKRTILATIMLVALAFSSKAYNFKSGGLYYNITSNKEPYTVGVTYGKYQSSSNYSDLSTADIPSTVTYDNKIYSVTSIGSYAFYGCSGLTSVTIPNSVTSIGSSAFEGCIGLTKVNAESIEGWLNISFANFYSNPLGYAYHLYVGNEEVTELVIPNSVTSISYAFYGCSGLTSVTIPNSVTSIGDDAFGKCRGLTSVTIPNSVTSIGHFAFGLCSGLTSVTIPNSVTSIGDDAFMWCSGLTSVTIPNSVTSIDDDAFQTCNKLTIYCQAAKKPSGWKSDWNSSNRPVKWGCKAVNLSANDDSFGTVSGGGLFVSNTSVTISATPNTGYHFTKWNDGNKTATRTFNVTEDIDLIAEFAIDTYTLALSGTNGTVSGAGTYDYGTSVKISATPNTGYHFTKWNDGNETATRTINVTSNIDLEAIFTINTYTVELSCGNGTVEGAGTYDYGTSVKISATPNTGYHFTKWNDGNETATRTINVTSNIDLEAIFTINTYTVELSCGNGTVEGAGTYEHGAEATISATPNDNYHFVGWSDKNTDNPRTITVVSDTAFVANFAIDTYTVTLSGDNGSVSGAGTYEHGAEATISATPNDNYHFVGWSDKNTDNPRTITVVSDTAFVANFAINTYTVTLSGDNGSIEGAGTYNYGAEVTLIATPNDNYHFVGWGDDNNENPRTITIVSDTTLTAVFAIDTLKVNTFAENGTVSGVGAYPYGTSASLTATPAEHYHFAKWNDGNTENPRSIKVTSDTTLIAVFAIDTLKVNTFAENGTVSGTGAYTYGTQTSLTATPAEHYHFAKWSDGNTKNPRSITITSDTTLTAVFAIDTFKITAYTENGTVSGAGAYAYGASASLTASPAEHYHFTKWSDGSAENPRSITITSDTTLTAVFAIDAFKVNTFAENGTVSGAGLYAYGTQTSLTATPAEHYHFAKWNDGNTENPRSIKVTSDTTLIAVFAIDTLKVTASAENGTVFGAGEFAYGTETILTATSAEHYHFAKWSDGNIDNPRTITVTSDTTLTAMFGIDTLKLEVNAENGTVSGAGEYAYGAETSLTATPAEHYHFAKWSDGNTENPRLVTVASDTILTAEFAIDTLKVTITAQNGTVEGAGEYAYGTNITLTATPAENYKFSRWSDGNTDNPRTITVTEDITLEAIFEKADAISANAVNAVNIYAHHNTIVVENADADIFVYDATGRLIARRDVACHVSITMPQQGIYIVKVGADAKRVIVGY